MEQTQCDICNTDRKDFILPEFIQGRILFCTCPLCFKKVGADIFNGKITCPACQAEANWSD